jgi:3-dehydroquinate dehydratase-2
MNILVLLGPDLNLLGVRESGLWGPTMLAQIDSKLARIAADAGAKPQRLESNHEGALIDRTSEI